MTLPRILTFALFVTALVGIAFGIYLKAIGTLDWPKFAGWEASLIALAGIIGRMVLFDARKK